MEWELVDHISSNESVLPEQCIQDFDVFNDQAKNSVQHWISMVQWHKKKDINPLMFTGVEWMDENNILMGEKNSCSSQSKYFIMKLPEHLQSYWIVIKTHGNIQ